MDINQWLDNRKTAPVQAEPQAEKCPPCPNCGESRVRYMRVTPEQLFYDVVHNGTVTDEERAKSGPCTKVEVDGRWVYWDKGIMGMLDQDQVQKYCHDAEEMKISKKHGKLIDTFRLASKECNIGKGYEGKKINSIEDRMRCMYSMVGGDL